MPSCSCVTLSRRDLRRQLAKQFSADDIFDGFCLDYFPDAYRQFSGEMSRCRKENILLYMISEADITTALCSGVFQRRRNRSLDPVSAEPPTAPSGRDRTQTKASAEFRKHAVIVAVLPRSKVRSATEKAARQGHVAPLHALDFTALLSVFAELINSSQAAS